MSGADDARVVGVRGERRVHLRDRRFARGDERAELAPRHEDVVGRDTRLPGVEALAGHDLVRCGARRDSGADITGDLPQLERQRHEVLGRRAHHDLAHARRAGEHQVIERELGEGLAHVGSAGHHGDAVARERVGQQLKEHLRRLGHQLARLQHHAIAGGERPDERRERQLHGVVPRRDHPTTPSGCGTTSARAGRNARPTSRASVRIQSRRCERAKRISLTTTKTSAAMSRASSGCRSRARSRPRARPCAQGRHARARSGGRRVARTSARRPAGVRCGGARASLPNRGSRLARPHAAPSPATAAPGSGWLRSRRRA